MIETVTKEVNQCTCEECGHKWESLVMPLVCPNPKCRTRKWNGIKKHGRPRKPVRRDELPEYQASSW